MKKWFAVLCCLLMALSSAWGDILLSESFDGMTDGNLPEGWTYNKATNYFSSAPYIGAAKPALKLSTATAELVSPTFPTGATSLSFFSGTPANGSGVGGKFVVSGFVGAEWVEIGTVECAEAGAQSYNLAITNSDIIQLKFAFTRAPDGGNASLDDIVVEGEISGITVTFDQTNWFEVVEGSLGATVTATADNGVPPYSYVWNCDQTEEITDVSGATLSIPATLTEGEYSLFVEVKDSDSEIGPQGGIFGIGLKVVKKYEVTVINGVDANGTISVSPEQAAAGDEVTIGWDPDPGYELESLSATWSGGDLEIVGGKFTMPAGAVTVSGTFAEYTGGDLVITFDEETATATKYASNSFVSAGITFDAVQCQGNSDGQSGSETDKAMRVRHIGGTNGCFTTASALEKPIKRIKFAYKATSASQAGNKWTLGTSTDGAIWSDLETVTTTAEWLTLDTASLDVIIPANSTFFRIISANTGTSGKTADFDNVEIWYGEATYRVELTGAVNGERFVYDADNPVVLTAAGADGTEPYGYDWTVNGELVVGHSGATFEFPELGAYDVTVKCIDAGGAEATASVSFSIEQQFAVNCPVGLEGGSIAVDAPLAFVGDSVTITATADAGYTLDGAITATWAEGNLEIVGGAFTMPAGDVTVEGSFRAVLDTATLPFDYKGPWKDAAVDGMTQKGLDKDGADGAAKFNDTGDWLQIKFDSEPGTLSFGIKGNSLKEETPSTFTVEEAAPASEGEEIAWTVVREYKTGDNLTNSKSEESLVLAADSRYVRFLYAEKGAGTVGIYDVVISKAGGEEYAVALASGATEITVGETFNLAFEVENYDGVVAWSIAEGDPGEIDAGTGVYTWKPSDAGSFNITVSATSGDLAITPLPVSLTVNGEGPGPEPVVIETTVTSDITFADGKAKLSVSIDNDEVVPTADDIWAASDLVNPEAEGYWKQAEGATIVPTNDGTYEVSVPEAAGNYISIGKPKFLNAE